MHQKFAVAAVAAATALLTTSCSTIGDQLEGTEATSVESPAPAAQILVTRDWGVVDGLLSVVVQNVTDRTLRYAAGVITARTQGNELLAASIIDDPSCCEVVDLAPGEEYGFYLDVGDMAESIERVDVAYRDISWAPAGEGTADAPTVRATPVRLGHNPAGAVVLADLESTEPYREVVAQAFVSDRAGKFLAVVSGRWTCLESGRQAIRMQLFHALPEGARIDRVAAHPVRDDPTRAEPECAESQRPL